MKNNLKIKVKKYKKPRLLINLKNKIHKSNLINFHQNIYQARKVKGSQI